MAMTLKISDAMMAKLRAAAQVHTRSLAGQAEHWMRLGRLVERDTRLGFARIDEALRAERSADELDPAEQAAFVAGLVDSLWEPSAVEEGFFRRMRESGDVVGYAGDDDEAIVTLPSPAP